jgi:hypothetical protein
MEESFVLLIYVMVWQLDQIVAIVVYNSDSECVRLDIFIEVKLLLIMSVYEMLGSFSVNLCYLGMFKIFIVVRSNFLNYTVLD